MSATGQETPQFRTLERTDTYVAAEKSTEKSLDTKPTETAGTKDNFEKYSLPKPPIASKATKKSLADKVQAILNEKVLKNTSIGIQITDLDSNDVIYSHNPNILLKPASNTKLVTTAAALNILGPEHQFESAIYLRGKVEKGVLQGDLQLHIDHDFTWSTRFYEAGDVPMRGLINQLKSAGIHKINGNVIVSGYVVYGGNATGTLSTAMHLKRAGNQFGALLKKNKITYKALSIRQNQSIEGKKAATWLSPVLSEAIVPLNRVSHNEYADMLMLAIGHKTSGKNTYEAGAKAIKSWLNQIGIAPKGYSQNDGSGLSHDNRMSADFFTKLTEHMLKSPEGREWADSLAISGYDGTYGGRLAIDDGKGRVYAKSGTLRDTISGSGFFVNRYDGHTYAFSIIVNGMRNKKLTRQAIDRIVRVFLGNHLNIQMPAAPTMTSFMKEDNGSVVARWNKVKDIEGYRVYESKDGANWSIITETKDNSIVIKNDAANIRVTSVMKNGAESKPSITFSYRPGKKTMLIVENARCRPDEPMRPVNHLIAHERTIASTIDETWGIQTVKTMTNEQADGYLFHSVSCNGSISWNADSFTKAVKTGKQITVDIGDAYLSADAQGKCDPGSGNVLGCYGEAIMSKDRRITNRQNNYRLKKAAGTGSTRPTVIKQWQGSKPIIQMNDMTIGAQGKTASGSSITILGFDTQSLDSQKTQNAVWKAIQEGKLSN